MRPGVFLKYIAVCSFFYFGIILNIYRYSLDPADANNFLENLNLSGSLNRTIPNVSFMETSYDIPQDTCFLKSFSATSVIQDLILVTSYLCSSILKQRSSSKHFAPCETSCSSTSSVENRYCSTAKCASSSSSSNNKHGQSITAALIALAPFWAIASLISQFGCSDDSCLHSELESALTSLFRIPLALNACCTMSEDCLQRIAQTEHNYLSSVTSLPLSPQHHQLHILQQEHQNCLLMRLTTRLRKSLRSHLAHPLLFCIVLTLSLRNDLSTKARAAFATGKTKVNLQEVFQRIITQSDENSLGITELVVTMAPKLVLQTDLTSQQSTPLIYLTAHRSVPALRSLPKEAETLLSMEPLVLGLVQILTNYVPSALTLCDSKGMYPLHFAARRGYSSVLLFLANRFGSLSLSLLDDSGKYPLHHALLSHHLHDEDTIVHLARLCPQLLDGQNSSFLYDAPTAPNGDHGCGDFLAFNPLHFALKISSSLQDRLNLCLSQWREMKQELLYPIQASSAEVSHSLEGNLRSEAGSLSHTASEAEGESSLEEEDSLIASKDCTNSSSDALAASSSLHFFAQYVLTMQHDASSKLESTSAATIYSSKKSNQRKLKRALYEICGEESSSLNEKDYKLQRCGNKEPKPPLEAMFCNSDGLTSGDSSVASIEIPSV